MNIREFAITNVRSKALLMHRVILGLTDPQIYADHKDHNRLNNQRSNLRAVTPAENAANQLFVGVGFNKQTGKWRAWTKTPTVNLGQYGTREEAEAALLLWEETGQRNVTARFPPETRLSPCCEAPVVRNGLYRGEPRYRCTHCKWTFRESKWTKGL